MSRDRPVPGTWRPWAPWVALLLWLLSLVLGMQAIYSALQLYYLILGMYGRLALAQQMAAPFVCVLGLLLIVVVMGTAEFHRTRIDQPSSWRVFAWTLGAELAVIGLYTIIILI